MTTFDEIHDALATLGLVMVAHSIKEIEAAYRRKAKQFHTDLGAQDESGMVKINHAYDILMDYCKRYRYTFDRQAWERAYPEETDRERYKRAWFG